MAILIGLEYTADQLNMGRTPHPFDQMPDRSTPITAFVLGGGGNLGAVQVGMLRALHEANIVPDVILGSSVGAVNGAAYAVDPTERGLADLEATWRDPATAGVFGAHLSPLALFRRATSMVENSKLRSLLKDRLGEKDLSDLKMPLQVVATSLRTGLERWFSDGSAVDAVLASAALPAVLPPVEIGGELFIDGGVVDNVPVSRATTMGVDRIVVLHVGIAKERPIPRRPIEVLLQSFSIARSYRVAAELAQAAKHAEVLVLPGVDPGQLRRTDFSRSGELMERAAQATERYLAHLSLLR